MESALAKKKEEVERVQESQMQIEQQLRQTQTEIERFTQRINEQAAKVDEY